jgi:hydrogenase maturation factor
MMPATVSSVDSKTGIVEVDSAGMSLRVHFPPASVANLKAGDKITLHMGYSK